MTAQAAATLITPRTESGPRHAPATGTPARPGRVARAHALGREIWRYRLIYLFTAPFFVTFAVFGVFPLLFSLYLSTQRWSGFDKMRFIGVGNYQAALEDPKFLTSLGNMVYLWLGHIFIMMALALLLAVLLNSKRLKGREIYRLIFYLPNVSAVAATALVFALIFDTNSGVLNRVLSAAGLPSVPWLTSPAWSKPSLILFNIWSTTGWFMVIMLAGLQALDPVLDEQAAIDGANALQRLWYVTIPGLRGVLFFSFIMETIGSFENFTAPYVLTSGGPMDSTLTPALYIYQSAFQFNKLGYAAAMSFILCALIIIASVSQARFWRQGEEQTT